MWQKVSNDLWTYISNHDEYRCQLVNMYCGIIQLWPWHWKWIILTLPRTGLPGTPGRIFSVTEGESIIQLCTLTQICNNDIQNSEVWKAIGNKRSRHWYTVYMFWWDSSIQRNNMHWRNIWEVTRAGCSEQGPLVPAILLFVGPTCTAIPLSRFNENPSAAIQNFCPLLPGKLTVCAREYWSLHWWQLCQ